MLKLCNICKKFPGMSKAVLQGINLKLKSGDFCIVIGSNGSGKTTLMNIISGESNVNSGEIYIDGEIALKNRTNFIASVVQDVRKGTISEMTLLENMVLSQIRTKKATFSFYNKYKIEIIEKIKMLNLNLEKYINKPLSCLSEGQKQMVATIMAITSNPRLLLLDEHTSALDPKMQTKIMEYTSKSITENNITTLMITHKLDDAVKYGNRLIMLHDGKIVFEVNEIEKKTLTVNELLKLFHKYEDLNLIA